MKYVRYEHEKPDDGVFFYRKDAKTQSFRRDLSGLLASLCLCGEKVWAGLRTNAQTVNKWCM